MPDTHNGTALISGGNRGIGLALVESLIRDGWKVLTVARGPMPTDIVVASHIQADLSTEAGIESTCKQAADLCDSLDLLVNNAGAIDEHEEWADVSPSVMISSFLLHAVAPLMLTRALAPALTASKRGAVINVGTIYSRIPDTEIVAYGPSKAAQEYVTRVSALQLAPDVRVNAVAPGHVRTQMTLSAPEEFLSGVMASIPLGSMESTDEVVSAIRFLGDRGARAITGTTVVIDGGYTNATRSSW